MYFSLQQLAAEVDRERMNGLFISPCGLVHLSMREDFDFTASSLRADAFGGNSQYPVLARFLAFMAGVANELGGLVHLGEVRSRVSGTDFDS